MRVKSVRMRAIMNKDSVNCGPSPASVPLSARLRGCEFDIATKHSATRFVSVSSSRVVPSAIKLELFFLNRKIIFLGFDTLAICCSFISPELLSKISKMAVTNQTRGGVFHSISVVYQDPFKSCVKSWCIFAAGVWLAREMTGLDLMVVNPPLTELACILEEAFCY
uniref:Uncharacterized protein n=1 Tax=Strigamia maritima TaxID=126957 RepID=T1IGR8_STRMM